MSVAARSVKYRATVWGKAGNDAQLMGLAPLAKILPVGLVSPEGVAGLGGCRELLGLPSERGKTAVIGYRLEAGLRQCAILSHF